MSPQCLTKLSEKVFFSAKNIFYSINNNEKIKIITFYRYRYQQEAQFHLNYVTGAIVGVLLFISLYFKLL